MQITPQIAGSITIQAVLSPQLYNKLEQARILSNGDSLGSVVQKALNVYLWCLEQKQAGFTCAACKETNEGLVQKFLQL